MRPTQEKLKIIVLFNVIYADLIGDVCESMHCKFPVSDKGLVFISFGDTNLLTIKYDPERIDEAEYMFKQVSEAFDSIDLTVH